MDTTYIKMCDCEEIQRASPEFPWSTHEFYAYRESYTGKLEDDQLIWLPRQDQLQEMLPDTFSNRTPVALVSKFDDFIGKELHQSNAHSIEVMNWSMSQLWLAFAMKENYNKTWTGDRWEVEG